MAPLGDGVVRALTGWLECRLTHVEQVLGKREWLAAFQKAHGDQMAHFAAAD